MRYKFFVAVTAVSLALTGCAAGTASPTVTTTATEVTTVRTTTPTTVSVTVPTTVRATTTEGVVRTVVDNGTSTACQDAIRQLESMYSESLDLSADLIDVAQLAGEGETRLATSKLDSVTERLKRSKVTEVPKYADLRLACFGL